MIAFLCTAVYVLSAALADAKSASTKSANAEIEVDRRASEVNCASLDSKNEHNEELDGEEACDAGIVGKGIKEALWLTASSLFRDKQSRHIFWLAFYTAVVLSNTLFNRFVWSHPLSSVLGGWGFFYIEKSLTGAWQIIPGSFDVRAAENIVMLMPEVWLAIIAVPGWFRKKGFILGSFIVAGGMSVMIEILQLIFFMGTFQISDIVYNTAGGVAAGMIGGIFAQAVNTVRNRQRKD